MAMEWSREMNLKIINELKKKKSLWDQCSSEYHDKNKREVDYQELAAIFQVPCSEVKKKIHNLKSQFRREYNKSRRTGGIIPYKSQWYGFHLMKFLKDDTEEVLNLSNKKDIRNHRRLNLESNVSSSNKMSDSFEKHLDNKDLFKNSKDSFYTLKSNEDACKIDRDEYTVFGEYVTFELKKITNPYVTAVTKHKIQECLFEAHMSLLSSMYDYTENNDRDLPYASQNTDECVTTSCTMATPTSTSLEQNLLNL